MGSRWSLPMVMSLRLHGGIGRNRRNCVEDAIARASARPPTLSGIEAGIETVAGKGEPVGGHPVLRIVERAGEIPNSPWAERFRACPVGLEGPEVVR
jgi:hypothetical protein